MKLVQTNTALIYYNRYSILQPRYAYYCLQLQHIICYSLLIFFTASDMDSRFTLADAGGRVTARGAGALLEVEAAAAATDAELKRVLM